MIQTGAFTLREAGSTEVIKTLLRCESVEAHIQIALQGSKTAATAHAKAVLGCLIVSSQRTKKLQSGSS